MPPNYTKVFFDFDSTLIDCESLDLIAEKKGIFAEIDAITKQAMNGEVPLEAIFGHKMSLLDPSTEDITYIIDCCVKRFTTGAAETIQRLQEQGIEVFVISSGFHEIIDPVVLVLDISADHVIANNLLFHPDGTYKEIDPVSPLTTSDGKPKTITHYITESDTAVMIGDGMTDAACTPVVTQFIGFGGNVRRPNVEKVSNIYITEKNLSAILPHILKD